MGTAGSGGGDWSAMLVFDGIRRLFDGNVTLTNIDIFNNTGYALDFQDIDATSAITITNGNGFTWNGLAGAAGGMRFDNFNGTITGNSFDVRRRHAGGRSDHRRVGRHVYLPRNRHVSSNRRHDDRHRRRLETGANEFTGWPRSAGRSTNDAGRSVSIQGISGAGTSVTIAGDITETGASEGILVNDNSGGTILFSGDITQTLTGQNGILLTSNTGTDISFGGLLDITTDGVGRAFLATGGGTLTVGGNANSLTTNGNSALEITGMTITNAAGRTLPR